MKTPEEMGFSSDAIFTRQALSYWEQFPPETFIAEIMYSIRTHISIMERYLKAISNDEKITDVTLADFSNQLSLKGVCQDALKRADKINKILILASHYSTSLEQDKRKQE